MVGKVGSLGNHAPCKWNNAGGFSKCTLYLGGKSQRVSVIPQYFGEGRKKVAEATPHLSEKKKRVSVLLPV